MGPSLLDSSEDLLVMSPILDQLFLDGFEEEFERFPACSGYGDRSDA